MKKLFFPITLLALYLSCKNPKTETTIEITEQLTLVKNPITFEEKLSNAALSIVDPTIDYDPTYFSIPYPNGDVPKNKGVCTDVVIRSYRKLGIDLQKEVHVDMKNNFSKYPTKWGLKKTDTNIDHRRVPNLEVFFTRKGQKLIVSDNPNDYKAGEIVTWMVNKKLPHIGIITHHKSSDAKRPMIVHNIGNGQVLEDCLFEYKIVGHFKFTK